MKAGHRSTPRLLVALASGGFAFPAFAFHPLISDDTGTQGERGNQVEFSIDRDRAREAGETTRTRTLPFTFTRGLTDALDVYAGISNVRIRSSAQKASASGSGNPVVGIKWRFLETEAGKTSFAVRPEVLLPVSGTRERNGLGNGRTSWALTLIVTQEFAFGAIHANLAAGRNRFRDPVTPASTTLHVSIAPVWNVSPHWKFAIDAGYETEKAGGVTSRSRFAELGAIYSPTETLDFGLGVIRSTNSADPRVTVNSVTVGITWRFSNT